MISRNGTFPKILSYNEVSDGVPQGLKRRIFEIQDSSWESLAPVRKSRASRRVARRFLRPEYLFSQVHRNFKVQGLFSGRGEDFSFR